MFVEFLDGSLAPTRAPVFIIDDNTTTWTQVGTSGPIPSDAIAARISLFGTPLSGGPDGYIDNVDFRVIPEPATVVLVGVSLVALECSCCAAAAARYFGQWPNAADRRQTQIEEPRTGRRPD